MNNEATREIRSTIEERIVKKDKNSNEYLILSLANGESIFCFPSQEINLDDFSEGHEYDFTVREGRNGANILVNFTVIS